MSLDSLDDATFRAMNDVDFPVARVLEGIDAAAAVGLPVKVNAVVKRGVNDTGIVDMARHFRGTGHALRFIEYMDVGTTNGWRLDDVVPAAEIVERIDAVFPLEAIEAAYRGEVAQRWRYRDGAGEIGVIASVTQPFCGDCTRARISAEGKLYTCLFAIRGTDLRALLRSGATRRRAARRRSPACGRSAPTATRRSAPSGPPSCRASRCATSAAKGPGVWLKPDTLRTRGGWLRPDTCSWSCPSHRLVAARHRRRDDQHPRDRYSVVPHRPLRLGIETHERAHSQRWSTPSTTIVGFALEHEEHLLVPAVRLVVLGNRLPRRELDGVDARTS